MFFLVTLYIKVWLIYNLHKEITLTTNLVFMEPHLGPIEKNHIGKTVNCYISKIKIRKTNCFLVRFDRKSLLINKLHLMNAFHVNFDYN